MILSPRDAEALAALVRSEELAQQGFQRREDGMVVPLPPPPPPKPEPVLRALLRDEAAWQAYLVQWEDWHGEHYGEPPSFPCLVVSTGVLEWYDGDGHLSERGCWHDFFTVADARELLVVKEAEDAP